MTKPALPKGIFFALSSAALFGASTPLAKLILGEGVDPWLLAGMLYLGSGIGLSCLHGYQRLKDQPAAEASLKRTDIPWMTLIVLAGGIVGPVLLMLGLTHTPASSAALLLNLEGLATMSIAWIVFRENLDGQILMGAIAILAGAVTLSWTGSATPVGWGSLLIVGACTFWGIDNNLTRKLAGSDPVQIASIKGLVAGITNVSLAVWHGAAFPSWSVAVGAGLVGLLGYGVSLVLFVLGLRHLGTARTGAYFSMAPFVGAMLSIAIFGESVTIRLCIAAALMAVGLYLHVAERHEHTHDHEALDHDHLHTHDIHHQHKHLGGDTVDEPHSHWHHHAPMRHRHPHYPDLHHRHQHG